MRLSFAGTRLPPFSEQILSATFTKEKASKGDVIVQAEDLFVRLIISTPVVELLGATGQEVCQLVMHTRRAT